MRVCDGITYMVIGEAPDLRSVDEEIRHRWNSLSIDTARREPNAKTHRNRSSFRNRNAPGGKRQNTLLCTPIGRNSLGSYNGHSADNRPLMIRWRRDSGSKRAVLGSNFTEPLPRAPEGKLPARLATLSAPPRARRVRARLRRDPPAPSPHPHQRARARPSALLLTPPHGPLRLQPRIRQGKRAVALGIWFYQKINRRI